MINLPTTFKGALALAFASLLGVSTAGASAPSPYEQAVTNLLPAGVSIQSASVSQLELATWGAIASGTHADAGNYLHDVLILRSDKDAIAANLTAGALAPAGLLITGSGASDPALSGTMAGLVASVGLAPTTLVNVSKAVITKMPIVSRVTSAASVGAMVSLNITGDLNRAAYATTLAPSLSSSGNSVVGAFYGGVSTNIADWFGFSKVAITKSPKSTAEILAAEISLQPSRVALSGSLASVIANGATSTSKGLIAEGIVRASGTANTANIINTVLALNPGVSGQAVTITSLSSFTTAVAGAPKGITSPQEAAGVMEQITKTLSNSTFGQGFALSEAQKTLVAAAAVKATLITDGQFNTAQAATTGVLDTIGTLSNPYAFAITVAKGTKLADNVGQVANAVANYLVPSSSLTAGASAPASYIALSGSMLKAFPKNATQISERVAQLIPPNTPSDNQAPRVAYAAQMATLFPSSASSIAVGVSLTDMQYADDISKAVVSLNPTTQKNAAVIAGAVSKIVPAEEGCEISAAMGSLIHSKVLTVAQAPAIATAIAASIAASDLHKTAQDEQQVIAAQMVTELMKDYVANASDVATVATNTAIVNAVAAVAKGVASVSLKTYAIKTSTDVNVSSGYASLVAGSAAQAVSIALPDLNADANDRLTLFTAIAKAVQAVTASNADGLVGTAVGKVVNDTTGTLYAVNCLTENETPVTNY